LNFNKPEEKNPSNDSPQPVSDQARRNASQTETTTPGKRKSPRRSSKAVVSRERRKENIHYAVISLISFLCGFLLLGLMIWKADLLTGLGLAGNLYYLVLIPMGLAAAGFLFGVLHSLARYTGKQLGGALELGGPIVGFALVVIGGFVLVPNVATFPLTVFVHGMGGTHDLVLRNSGRVVLDLGPDRRSEAIGEEGQAYFPSLPANFRGQEIPIGLEADGFELSDPQQKHRLDGNSIYLSVRRQAGHLSGRVQDENGNPVSGASIDLAGLLTTSDSQGHFELTIPGDRLQSELELEAAATGYVAKRYKVVPNANELVVQLTRAP
jgi:hypothetical protein